MAVAPRAAAPAVDATAARPDAPLLVDNFRDDRARGRVLGPAGAERPHRDGRDIERVLSIDGGALRIQPLLREGWQRACLGYGPFAADEGLALAVHALNGHNTSQSENMSDTLRTRLSRWARGSGSTPVGARLWRWLRSGRVRRVVRQVRWWRRLSVGAPPVPRLDENFAVGFYRGAACDPLADGAGFVMHATGAENGELWVGQGGGRFQPVVRGVQNVPIHYVVVLRRDDAVYLAASLPGARGLGAYPHLRPLAVGPRPPAGEVHVGIHQGVLGQIGFRADTRVHSVRVARPGSAAAGGRLLVGAGDGQAGGGPLTEGGIRRGDALLWPQPVAVGLVRADLMRADLVRADLVSADLHTRAVDGAPVTLVWRADAGGGRWELRASAGGLALAERAAGADAAVVLASEPTVPAQVQILDDGNEIAVFADGRLAFDRRFAAAAAAGAAAGVTVGGESGGSSGNESGLTVGCLADPQGAVPSALAALEIFPREVPLPPALDGGSAWVPAPGVPVAADDFAGPAGDLDGRRLPVGNRCWRRLLGTGTLALTGAGEAGWQADPRHPLSGRTVYAIDWDDPTFVDVSVTLTPPGTARGQGQHGTAGFCLWQDARNQLLVNTWLDDCYGGASLSSFYHLDGFEDLYDAIWTNVGDRVSWGRPLRLRLVSDGLRFTVYIGEEPVLHRSLADVYPGHRPLRIARVGLLGNWEWGADTGSRFAGFRAAAGAAAGAGGRQGR